LQDFANLELQQVEGASKYVGKRIGLHTTKRPKEPVKLTINPGNGAPPLDLSSINGPSSADASAAPKSS